MPIGISVDHRVFDGNFHAAKILQNNFDRAFNNFKNNVGNTKEALQTKEDKFESFKKLGDQVLAKNLDYGFRLLALSSHYWRSNGSVSQIFESALNSPQSHDRFETAF